MVIIHIIPKIDLMGVTVSGKCLHGSSHQVIVMTEKVKTVLVCFFLLPYFQTRGHSRPRYQIKPLEA